MNVAILAEHDNRTLKPATLNAVTAALAIAGETGGGVHMLVAGHDCSSVAAAAARVAGIERVLHADDPALAHHLAENLAPLIARVAPGYGHLLAAATTHGKNVIPRVAALLDVSPLSDIVEVIAADTFVRPIYAGNALAKVCSSDPIKLITVRTTRFEATTGEDGAAPIEPLEGAGETGLAHFVGLRTTESERPELTTAGVVVSGGRGMGGGENFRLLEVVADKLGAAIGASRAAVDAGYVPNDYQVGQTGKVVAPALYLAVGISGAIQHLAGMKDSRVIVAINNDPDAPIFRVADYGLVMDLFEALPALAAELDDRK